MIAASKAGLVYYETNFSPFQFRQYRVLEFPRYRTFAQYSALMVMKQKYGSDNMHRFLKHELDRYLRGRAGEIRRERPLVLVQNEPYVWYQKGGQVMYTLADYIGEDKVNLALHNFLMKYRYANADDSQSGPYPDTRQLLDALRAQTPADLHYYINDAFESIVL